MKLTASLAKIQLKTNRRRTFWTLLGIIFSGALITAVFGVAASGIEWVARVADTPQTLFYNSIVMSMGTIVNLIVVGVSVVVVSNSFRVSAGERTGQFGILKSVGATKKQITQTVVYEGVYLLIIGVPLGILLGIAFQWGGIFLANDILGAARRLCPRHFYSACRVVVGDFALRCAFGAYRALFRVAAGTQSGENSGD